MHKNEFAELTPEILDLSKLCVETSQIDTAL